MGKDNFAKIPNGHPAIEHRIEFMYSEGVRKGKISLNKFVEVCSTNAARIFGMYPKKGTISIGSDADIVIFIYRDEFYYPTKEEWEKDHPEEEYPKGLADIIIAKHRNGPTGQIKVRFRHSLTKFENFTKAEPSLL